MPDPFLVRNLTYGLQDSLVSTTGVLVGVALGGLPSREVVVTGVVLVLSEALSMSLGAFVSEDAFMQSADDQKPPLGRVAKYALVMFAAYLAAGLVLLLPFWLNVPRAWQATAGLGTLGLFALASWVRGPRYGAAIAGLGVAITAASALTGRALGAAA